MNKFDFEVEQMSMYSVVQMYHWRGFFTMIMYVCPEFPRRYRQVLRQTDEEMDKQMHQL